jgi:hypothetical protein
LTASERRGPVDVLRYDEATVSDIQAAFKAKTLTCRGLVQMYLDRIDAYDRKGPALNAIVVTNPDALKLADALDAKYVQSGPVGPLHRVPLIVKDNYETTDMPTSAGSLSLGRLWVKRHVFHTDMPMGRLPSTSLRDSKRSCVRETRRTDCGKTPIP